MDSWTTFGMNLSTENDSVTSINITPKSSTFYVLLHALQIDTQWELCSLKYRSLEYLHTLYSHTASDRSLARFTIVSL